MTEQELQQQYQQLAIACGVMIVFFIAIARVLIVWVKQDQKLINHNKKLLSNDSLRID